jgi:hypothetical protein
VLLELGVVDCEELTLVYIGSRALSQRRVLLAQHVEMLVAVGNARFLGELLTNVCHRIITKDDYTSKE